MTKKLRGMSEYEISSNGSVYSLKGVHSKELKGYKTNGAIVIQFVVEGQKVRASRGALVLEHFAKNPYSKTRIIHKNGNKCDDRLSNLMYASNRDVNLLSRNKQGKLSLKRASAIRQLYKRGQFNQTQLAEKYKVTQSTISNIVNGVIWVMPEENGKDPMMSVEVAEGVRKEFAKGVRQMELAKKYDIKQGLVSLIVNNKRHSLKKEQRI